MIDLLAKLPQGTTVRTWPTYMVYPPMFYVRNLHYCDQLNEEKDVDPTLLPLPEYLYIEKARPDVVCVPAPWAGRALGKLAQRHPDDSYELRKTLKPDWTYTSKPEIPNHVFRPTPISRQWYPGMAVLVRKESPAADHPALATQWDDPHALYRFAEALEEAGKIDQACKQYLAVLKISPEWPRARFNLANLLAGRDEIDEAIYHYRRVSKSDPNYAKAQVNLGGIMLDRGRFQETINHCRKALQADTALAVTRVKAHANLAQALYARGSKKAAIAELHKALELEPPQSILAGQIRQILRQWNAQQ